MCLNMILCVGVCVGCVFECGFLIKSAFSVEFDTKKWFYDTFLFQNEYFNIYVTEKIQKLKQSINFRNSVLAPLLNVINIAGLYVMVWSHHSAGFWIWLQIMIWLKHSSYLDRLWNQMQIMLTCWCFLYYISGWLKKK